MLYERNLIKGTRSIEGLLSKFWANVFVFLSVDAIGVVRWNESIGRGFKQTWTNDGLTLFSHCLLPPSSATSHRWPVTTQQCFLFFFVDQTLPCRDVCHAQPVTAPIKLVACLKKERVSVNLIVKTPGVDLLRLTWLPSATNENAQLSNL